MKVCLLAYRGNPYAGGQGIYLYHLSRGLAELGHRVDVIVGPPYPLALEPFATVHKLPNLNLWGRYGRDALPPEGPLRLLEPGHLWDYALTRLRFFPEPLSFSVRALLRLGRLLQRRRFDVLHDVQTLGYGMLGMKAFGLPLLTTVHHPLTIDRREAFARDRTLEELYHTAVFYPVAMQGRVIRRLDGVITASAAGREAIARDFRVPPRRIRVVPGGLDTRFFYSRPAQRRSESSLLFVGNTDDWKKGTRTLLQALRALPAPVTLRIVDDPYPRKKLAYEEAQRLGVEGRVTFLGKLSRVALRDEYRRCTLLVQPSLYEGLGLPAAEAMACGAPVVATAVGAVPEVVPPAAGLLVPPADPAALAAAVQALLDDPVRRSAMGEAGRAHVRAELDWSVTAARTARVYGELLGTEAPEPLPALAALAEGAQSGASPSGESLPWRDSSATRQRKAP